MLLAVGLLRRSLDRARLNAEEEGSGCGTVCDGRHGRVDRRRTRSVRLGEPFQGLEVEPSRANECTFRCNYGLCRQRGVRKDCADTVRLQQSREVSPLVVTVRQLRWSSYSLHSRSCLLQCRLSFRRQLASLRRRHRLSLMLAPPHRPPLQERRRERPAQQTPSGIDAAPATLPTFARETP